MHAESAQTDPTQSDSTETITAQVVRLLRADILSGELSPGSKLKISELQSRYGSGSSPVREGLSLLVSDGLVERLHQRGFRVRPASLTAFRELLKTREWIEERALRESIAHGDSQWEEAVLVAHHRLNREARWLDDTGQISNPQWETHHKSFHITLVSASGSSILSGYCEQLYDQNIRYRQLANAGATHKRAFTDEHASLCTAAIERDTDLAVSLLLAHYRATGQTLSARLEDMERLQSH